MRSGMASSICPPCDSKASRMNFLSLANWRRRPAWEPDAVLALSQTPTLRKPVSDVTTSAAGAASVGAQTLAPAPTLFNGQRHERLETAGRQWLLARQSSKGTALLMSSTCRIR
jgi:hypothetical protein